MYVSVKLGEPDFDDMQKVSIPPQTRFVNNRNSLKQISQSIPNNLESLWKSSFIGYKYAKYLISEKKFSQFIRVPSIIIISNLL